jgi:hypothetical protein
MDAPGALQAFKNLVEVPTPPHFVPKKGRLSSTFAVDKCRIVQWNTAKRKRTHIEPASESVVICVHP